MRADLAPSSWRSAWRFCLLFTAAGCAHHAEAAPAPAVEAKPASSTARPASSCGTEVKRVARMWLGFSPDMDLGQFEEATVQERRIVKAIRESVCAVVEAPERSQLGAPHQVLFDLARAKARLELVSVQFVNFAEHRATARMRAAQGEEDGGAGNSVEWEFAIEGDGERFQVRDLVLVAH